MNLFVVCLLLGFVPMIVYSAIMWWIDHWEREPLSLIIGCFAWGAVPSIVLALFWSVYFEAAAASFFYEPGELQFITYSIIAPVTEEIAKGIGLLIIFLFFRREIDSLLDGILFGAVIGFGFAAVENVFYFIGFGSESPATLTFLVVLRAFAFGLNHAFFTSLTGLGFAIARFQRNILLKFATPTAGLALAMLMHGVHNYLAVEGLGGIVKSFFIHWFGVFWVFLVIVWSLNRQGNLIARHLDKEVSAGVLTAEQARNAAAFSHRLSYGFDLFGHLFTRRENDRRFDQLCAELALKKHHLATLGDESGNDQAVDKLRKQIVELSQRLA